MIVRLKKTIQDHEAYGRMAHFKQRRVQFKHWNNRSEDDLHRLLAIAERIYDGAGTFVPQAELLHLGRAAAAGHSSGLRADCRSGGSSDFGRWILSGLWPAVDRFQQNFSRQTIGVSFYMFPQTPEQMYNVRQSYEKTAQATAAIVGGKAAIEAVDVQSFLALLPGLAQKRVLVSILAQIAGSKSFLQARFGLSATRQNLAARKVTAALIAVSKFEVMGLQVRSDVTTAAAATDFKRRREATLVSELSNDHAGGRLSVLEACEGIGVDLGAVIEDVAARLGKHHYGSGGDDSAGGGGGAGSRRDSEQIFRQCTWEALASEVCQMVAPPLIKISLKLQTVIYIGKIR